MRSLTSSRSKHLSIGILIVFSLFTSSNLASGAIDADQEERFKVEMKSEDGWHGVNFDNTIQDWAIPSHIVGRAKPNSGPESLNYADAVCKSLEDSECIKPGWNLEVRSLFDKCASEADRDCIVSLTATKSDGTKLVGEFKEVLASRHAFEGDTKQGIPGGGGVNIWTISDGTTSTDYALAAGIQLFVNGAAESKAAGNDSRVKRSMMIYALQPLEIVSGPKYREVFMDIQNGILIGNTLNDGVCFVSAEGRCGLIKAFDTSTNFELTVRFSKGVPGWMVGRIQGFKLATKNLPAQDGFEMSVSGKPSSIGAVFAWSRWKDTTDEIKKLYEQGVDGRQWRGGTKSAAELEVKDGEARTILTLLNEAGERSIKNFNAWLPLISDKASAMRTRWNLKTVADKSGQYDSCSAGKGLVGVINSNASVYSDGPPSFNKETGTLEYKVAAPHYRSDGTTKHLGSYDLTMRSDVARCLYGFSDAPISATVAIESDGGTNIVSTESVIESNGLIRLSAAGFTFSSPTIKVKLNQQVSGASTAATPQASPSAISKVAKKTITCIKGTTKKKVVAIKPKCPNGFKKA